jgi:5'(3')-deoxyribonucleotidase
LGESLLIEKVYFDIDGVFTNWDAEYKAKFGVTPQQMALNREAYILGRKVTNNTGFYKYLTLIPDALAMVKVVTSKGIPYEFLSSTGDYDNNTQCELDKKYWVNKNFPGIKFNVVTHGYDKAQFAESNAVLIDDTKQNIDLFYEHGGIGFHHTTIYETINFLNKYL